MAAPQAVEPFQTAAAGLQLPAGCGATDWKTAQSTQSSIHDESDPRETPKLERWEPVPVAFVNVDSTATMKELGANEF